MEYQLKWQKGEKVQMIERVESLNQAMEGVVEKNQNFTKLIDSLEQDKMHLTRNCSELQ
jgi:hypothetical protein